MLRPKNKLNKKKSAELGLKYKMQLDQAKAEFEKKEFASESEDGNVSVIVSGMREIKQLSIADEFLKNSHETVEAALTSVVNKALSAVREANKQLTADVAEQFNAQNGITVK
jgi:DNA-binding protein YbaB